MPPAVRQELGQLLNQGAGSLTSQAAETQMSITQLNAEDQVVHSVLDQSPNRFFRPEVKRYIHRSLRALLLGLHVHVASGLEREHSRGLTVRTCEASQAAARVSVLIIDEQRRANSPILAPVPIAARKDGGARLTPIETPVSALLGAKACETFTVALAYSTILARLLFTPTDDFSAESTLREENASISLLETHG